jgi:uncharacterized protein (DUF433 family)
MNFERITHDPRVMGGKPTVRGMRVTVGTIVGMIGAGITVEQVLTDYPYLEREDILQALRYAAEEMGSDSICTTLRRCKLIKVSTVELM